MDAFSLPTSFQGNGVLEMIFFNIYILLLSIPGFSGSTTAHGSPALAKGWAVAALPARFGSVMVPIGNWPRLYLQTLIPVLHFTRRFLNANQDPDKPILHPGSSEGCRAALLSYAITTSTSQTTVVIITIITIIIVIQSHSTNFSTKHMSL